MERMVRERTMPPWQYRLMHPRARFNAAVRAILANWIEAVIAIKGGGL
jgi:hypothetical protein